MEERVSCWTDRTAKEPLVEGCRVRVRGGGKHCFGRIIWKVGLESEFPGAVTLCQTPEGEAPELQAAELTDTLQQALSVALDAAAAHRCGHLAAGGRSVWAGQGRDPGAPLPYEFQDSRSVASSAE